MLGGSVHTIKKNTEALVVTSMETGLEVNADKTKHMVMSQDKNAGQSHNTKIDSSTFKRVEHLICLGKTVAHQNSVRKKLQAD